MLSSPSWSWHHVVRPGAGRAAGARRSRRRLSRPRRPRRSPGDTSPRRPQKPDEPPEFEETVVVTGTAGEQKLVDAAADDERHHERRRSRRRRRRTSPSCCARSPASTSRRSRRATSTSRAARRPARWPPVSSRCSTAARLYQDFFGFVMWDFLPVNFNEVKQVEVIRGPASAVWGANALYGVVNVISKTPRELKGTSATFGVRRLRSAGAPTPARSGTSAAPTPTRRTIAGRTSCRAAATRRTRWRGRPARFPATIPRSASPDHELSAVRQHRHDAAEVRRPRRLRLRGRPQALVLRRRRRHRRHHALRHRPVRHQQRLGDGLRQGELHQGRPARRVLHQRPQRRRRPAADPRPQRRADHLRLRHRRRSTSTSSNVQTFAKRHVVSYGGNLRFNSYDLSIAPGRRQPHRVRRSTGRTRSSSPTTFRLGSSAAASTASTSSTTSCSRRASPFWSSRTPTRRSGSRTTAYRSPSVINNFIDLIISQPLNLAAASAGRAPTCCRSNIVGNPDLEVQSLDAVRARLLGRRHERPRDHLGGVLHELAEERHPVHAADGVVHRGQPAVELAAAAGLHRRARAQGIFLPSTFTYLNFGKSTSQGIELGVNALRQPLRQRLRQLLVSGRPGPEGLPAVRAEPAAEQPLQHRRQLHLRPVPRQPLRHATPTKPSGRTC